MALTEWLHRPASYRSVLGGYIGLGLVLLVSFFLSEQARDQTCLLFENGHLADVQQLSRTYDYLLHPVKYDDHKGSELYNVVLASLPQTEKTAKTDQAPEFCDGGSLFHGEMGRPEPDPVVPERPISLRPPVPRYPGQF